MIKFFSKKLNKKGFTLAELLIVIAIIAILVAIAVPIFTSELNKAKIARDRANIRAAKAAGVAIILGDENQNLNTTSTWLCVAKFDANTHDLTDVMVSAATTGAANSEPGAINYASDVAFLITGLDLSTSVAN